MDKQQILQYLKEHKDELQQRYGVVKIGLFGSYAKDEQNENSDIDIVVEIDKEHKRLSSFFGLKRELEKAFAKRVDLGTQSSIKPLVKKYIQKEILYV